MKQIFISVILISLIIILGSNVTAEEILTQKQKNIVMISSYTATGDLNNLESAIKNGLESKMTVNEIKEILVQMYAYCGFPRSLNALSTLLKVTKNGNYTEGKSGKSLLQKRNRNKSSNRTGRSTC